MSRQAVNAGYGATSQGRPDNCRNLRGWRHDVKIVGARGFHASFRVRRVRCAEPVRNLEAQVRSIELVAPDH
jgi:hypothetical protein